MDGVPAAAATDHPAMREWQPENRRIDIESTKPSFFNLFPSIGALLLALCGSGLASQRTQRPPCATQSASMTVQQEDRDETRLTAPEGLNDWALAIKAAGGIIGNGAGGVTIRSRGDAVVGPFGPGAKFMAAPANLQPLFVTVLAPKPDNWRACYGRDNFAKGMEVCCDQLRLKLPPEIRAVTVNGLTAHFGGEIPPVNVDGPPEYGVETLWFTFEGEQRFYVFKPKGELFFTDWSFDLFSPDGAHVLLPQSHYGPYHVVATDRLKDYLLGRAKPNYVATKRGGRSDPAMVHSGGHWISAREIQFTVACCGSSETLTYGLGQQAALKASNADRTGGYQLLADGSIHPDRDGPPQGLYVRGTIRSSNSESDYRFEPVGDVRGTGEFGKSGHPGWLELHDGSFHSDEEARVPARPYVRGFRVSDGRFQPRSGKIIY